MSDRLYGRKLTNLSSTFNERAGPRTSDDRKFRHTVKPAPRTPHYARVSELYPMQAHSGSLSDFRYRPTADIIMPGSDTPGDHRVHVSGGGVSIPVVHLDSPNYYVGRTGGYTGGPPGGGGNYRPSNQIRKGPLTTTGPISISTDPEAEVDALTDALIQKMETPRSGPVMSPYESAADGTASPAGSIRRGSGGATSLSSRVARLQQQAQQRVGSPSTANSSNTSGSPLTVGSPRTSSPTNSSTSSGMNDSFLHNNCFRCRRPLVPPESATLGPGTPTPPIINLTGALGVRLHEACFTCYICRTKLNPQGYYHSLHRLLCPTCVRDGAVESCENCRRPIGERIVRALGSPYHPGCFVCSVCHTHLDAKPFTVDVHGRPLCLDDFHKRYAPRCAVCNRPIGPELGSQEARRVVAGDSNYHLHCYGVKAADSGGSTPTPSMATA